MKALLDATKKKGSARLDDIAIYATKAPSVSFGGVDSVIMRIVDPSSVQALNAVYGFNRDMLVMYASMGQATRLGLSRGQKMQVPSVTSNSMVLTGDMVYNSPDGPQVANLSANAGGAQGNGGNRGQQQPVQTAAALSVSFTVAVAAPPAMQQGRGGPGGPGGPQFMMNFGGSDMTTERTEVLPRGVPGASILSMNANSEPIAKAVRKNAGLARTYSAQSMGMEKAFSEMPDPNGNRPQGATIAWDGYVPGTKYTYSFLFEFAPGISLRRTLEDNSFDPSAAPVGYDQLPTEFKNNVTTQYQQMKENMSRRLNNRAADEQRVQGRRGGGLKPPAP